MIQENDEWKQVLETKDEQELINYLKSTRDGDSFMIRLVKGDPTETVSVWNHLMQECGNLGNQAILDSLHFKNSKDLSAMLMAKKLAISKPFCGLFDSFVEAIAFEPLGVPKETIEGYIVPVYLEPFIKGLPGTVKSPFLIFNGPPGTGKSQLVRCIAGTLKRPLFRLSVIQLRKKVNFYLTLVPRASCWSFH